MKQRRLQVPQKPFLDQSTRQQWLQPPGHKSVWSKAAAEPHGGQGVKFKGMAQQ